MARKTVVISDLTGEVVNDPVRLTVQHGASVFVLDVDSSEEIVTDLKAKGTAQKRRGRKPQSK